MQIRIMLLCLFCMSVSGTVTVANAQSIVSDSEKQKQWKSMENGPWDFAPDWYYFFLHKKYSGAEIDVPLNYADYYFLEALMRKRDLEK